MKLQCSSINNAWVNQIRAEGISDIGKKQLRKSTDCFLVARSEPRLCLESIFSCLIFFCWNSPNAGKVKEEEDKREKRGPRDERQQRLSLASKLLCARNDNFFSGTDSFDAKNWKCTRIKKFSNPNPSAFFTPIPLIYTNLPLDGIARNDLLSSWICKITKFVVSGSIFSYRLIPEDRKYHLVWAWIEHRASCFKSDRSNHYTMPPRAKSITFVGGEVMLGHYGMDLK